MNWFLFGRMYKHIGNRSLSSILRVGICHLCGKDTPRPFLNWNTVTGLYLFCDKRSVFTPASPSAPVLMMRYFRQSFTYRSLFESTNICSRDRPGCFHSRFDTDRRKYSLGCEGAPHILSGFMIFKTDNTILKGDYMQARKLLQPSPISCCTNTFGCTSASRMFSTIVPKHGEYPFKFPILVSSNVLGEIFNNSQRHVGRSSRNQDDNKGSNFHFNHEKSKLRLRDRTKQNLRRRVSKLTKSFSLHNKSLKDQLDAQKIKGMLTVGKLRKKFKVKKENIKTLPNLLTTLRMASAPLLAYLVVNDYFSFAFSLFVVAGVTDLLDGYIARNFKNQKSALGTALDPLADKLLVSFLTLSLTSAGLIPMPVTILILGRDAGLIIASFYIRYISLPPPRTLARYFDVSLVTAKLYPSNISKLNTVFQLSYVASTLASPVFDFVDHPLLQLLMYTTAATTFLSGADYVLTWRRRLKIVKNK